MMLLLKVKSADQSIEHLSTEERSSLEKLCAALTTAAITSWLRQVMELLAAVRHGHAARLEWEMLLVACAQPEVDPSLQGLERRLERLESGGARIGGETVPASDETLSLLVARLERLESQETGGSEVDPRWLARLEALESADSSGHDPRLWEKLTRLEAELDAWKDRLVEQPQSEAPQSLERQPLPTKAKPFEAPTPEPPPSQTPSSQAPVAPTLPTSGSPLLRDEVDDWLEMPPVLVNPEDFRRELSLFSSQPAKTEPKVQPQEPPVAESKSERVEPVKALPETSPAEPTVTVRQVEVVTTEVVVSSPPAKLESIDIKDFWRSLMLAVREKDKRLHAVLTDARLTVVEDGRFEIALPTGFEWHKDKLQEGRGLLEAVASELAGGCLLRMECTLGGEKATPPKDSEHDDLVARATGVFGGASIVE